MCCIEQLDINFIEYKKPASLDTGFFLTEQFVMVALKIYNGFFCYFMNENVIKILSCVPV